MSESTANRMLDRLTGKEDQPKLDSDDREQQPVNQVVDNDDDDTDVEITEEEIVDEDDNDVDEEVEEEHKNLPNPVKEALKKERKARKEADGKVKDLEREVARLKGEEPEDEDAPTPQEDTKFKTLYVRTQAETALVKAGFTNPSRFVKMIDFDLIDVDEDGTVDGLEDQVADLKKDFADILNPQKKTVRKTTTKADAAGYREAPAPKKKSSDILTNQLGLA